MYIPVWLLLLICAPLIGALLLYVGTSLMLGIAQSSDSLTRTLAPYRHLGRWLDYAIACGILAALVSIAAMLS